MYKDSCMTYIQISLHRSVLPFSPYNKVQFELSIQIAGDSKEMASCWPANFHFYCIRLLNVACHYPKRVLSHSVKTGYWYIKIWYTQLGLVPDLLATHVFHTSKNLHNPFYSFVVILMSWARLIQLVRVFSCSTCTAWFVQSGWTL